MMSVFANLQTMYSRRLYLDTGSGFPPNLRAESSDLNTATTNGWETLLNEDFYSAQANNYSLFVETLLLVNDPGGHFSREDTTRSSVEN